MKKYILLSNIVILTICIIFLFNAYYYADFKTSLSEGTYIQANNKDLSAPNWSVPVVFDWNDDGKKDLLIGRHYRERGEKAKGQGNVSFYENTGTDVLPAFDGYYNIQTCMLTCKPINVASSG